MKTVKLHVAFKVSRPDMEDLAAAVLLGEALVRRQNGERNWFRMSHWRPEDLRSYVFVTLTGRGMEAVTSAQKLLKDSAVAVPEPLAGGDGKHAVDAREWKLAVSNARSTAPQVVAAAWNWSGRSEPPRAEAASAGNGEA